MFATQGKGYFNPFSEQGDAKGPIPWAIGWNHLPPADYRARKERSREDAFMVLEWVLQGQLEVQIQGRRLEVPEGHGIVLIKPMDVAYGGTATRGDTAIQTVWFSVTEPMLVEYLLKRLPHRSAVIPEYKNLTQESIQDLYRDLKPPHGKRYEKVYLQCHSLWRTVAAWVDENARRASSEPPFNASILQQISVRMDERRLIQNLAKQYGLSREHFGRVFKEKMGRSPRDYLAKMRLERLMELLRSTDLKFTAAAEAAGYPSYLLATRSFQKAHGMTMGAWRKRGL